METITDDFGAKYPELRPKRSHASKIASEARTSTNGVAAWRNAERREQKVEDWQNTGYGMRLERRIPTKAAPSGYMNNAYAAEEVDAIWLRWTQRRGRRVIQVTSVVGIIRVQTDIK